MRRTALVRVLAGLVILLLLHAGAWTPSAAPARVNRGFSSSRNPGDVALGNFLDYPGPEGWNRSDREFKSPDGRCSIQLRWEGLLGDVNALSSRLAAIVGQDERLNGVGQNTGQKLFRLQGGGEVIRQDLQTVSYGRAYYVMYLAMRMNGVAGVFKLVSRDFDSYRRNSSVAVASLGRCGLGPSAPHEAAPQVRLQAADFTDDRREVQSQFTTEERGVFLRVLVNSDPSSLRHSHTLHATWYDPDGQVIARLGGPFAIEAGEDVGNVNLIRRADARGNNGVLVRGADRKPGRYVVAVELDGVEVARPGFDIVQPVAVVPAVKSAAPPRSARFVALMPRLADGTPRYLVWVAADWSNPKMRTLSQAVQRGLKAMRERMGLSSKELEMGLCRLDLPEGRERAQRLLGAFHRARVTLVVVSRSPRSLRPVKARVKTPVKTPAKPEVASSLRLSLCVQASVEAEGEVDDAVVAVKTYLEQVLKP